MTKKKILIFLFPLLAAVGAAALFFQMKSARPTSIKTSVLPEKKETPENLEALRSLPYLQYSNRKADENLRGVTVHNRTRAFPGLNLYAHQSEIRLVNMDGKLLHKWTIPSHRRYLYALMLPEGDVLVVVHHRKIALLDWNSKIKWEANITAHHDVAPLPDGTCMVPVREGVRNYNSYDVVFDSIFHLSNEGAIMRKWSTWDNFHSIRKLHLPSVLDQAPAARSKERKKKGRFNYYHTNSISMLPDTELGKKDRRFRKGNILICLRNPGLLIIQDPKTRDIVWSWGPGILDFPHMPSLTPDGTILVFDNGMLRGYSRILEIEPTSGKIVWEYTTNPRQDFFSSGQGSCQRLPNGNTLICDSEKGRAFEVDKNGKIVWEFWNPEIRNQKRSTIYRFLRYYQASGNDLDPFSYFNLPIS